jgi:hypothetical protein
MEVAVVLAIFAILTTSASMAFVSIMKTVRAARQSAALSERARVGVEQLVEELRESGGPDLGPHGHIIVAKAGGQRGTDVFWTMRQNEEYGVCAVQAAVDDRLQFESFVVNGQRRCCFEAGDVLVGTTPLYGDVPRGAPFRRTAVLVDGSERVLPVFLSGKPSGNNCELDVKSLPGVREAVPESRRPRLGQSVVVLADVKRHYVDFDPLLEAAQPALGILFAQTELDGAVDSFANERLRIAHGVADLRIGLGYLDGTDDGGAPPPLADSSVVERREDRRGWRAEPAANGTEPQMVGVALRVGAAGAHHPGPLPWSTTATPTPPMTSATMVGRVTLRDRRAP